MSKSVVGIIIAAVAVLGVVGVVMMGKSKTSQTNTTTTTTSTDQPASNTNSQASSSETSSQTAVEMKNTAYSPTKIKIKKGTTVTWTNKDSIEHDVAPDQPSAAFVGSNGLLSKGESYSFTFNTVGTFTYHCTPHASFMKGTVEVVE